MKEPNGGPAFPLILPAVPDAYGRRQFDKDAQPIPGMSLRDYFAAGFAAQICAGTSARMVADRDQRYNEKNWKEVVAANAYEFADAMLAERSKP